MDISIIIVSWNVRSQLYHCLDSIAKTEKGIKYETFVIDNASADNSVEMVRKKFPWVNLISNKKNFGFAKACNQGIRLSKGKIIILLNPDTKIHPDTLKKTVSFMECHADAGILGGKLLNTNGSIQPSVRKFPDLASHILILFKAHRLLPKLKPISKYLRDNFNYNKTQAVDQVMGAFFTIRRQLIEKIGLLDEHFYVWYEEVDYCRRAVNSGWKIYYSPEITIQHLQGASFCQIKPIAKQIIFNRSMLYYFYKHKPVLEYIILLILYPISIILSAIVQLLGINKLNRK